MMQQVGRKCRRVALFAFGTAGLMLGSIYLLQNKLLYHPRKFVVYLFGTRNP